MEESNEGATKDKGVFFYVMEDLGNNSKAGGGKAGGGKAGGGNKGTEFRAAKYFGDTFAIEYNIVACFTETRWEKQRTPTNADVHYSATNTPNYTSGTAVDYYTYYVLELHLGLFIERHHSIIIGPLTTEFLQKEILFSKSLLPKAQPFSRQIHGWVIEEVRNQQNHLYSRQIKKATHSPSPKTVDRRFN